MPGPSFPTRMTLPQTLGGTGTGFEGFEQRWLRTTPFTPGQPALEPLPSYLAKQPFTPTPLSQQRIVKSGVPMIRYSSPVGTYSSTAKYMARLARASPWLRAWNMASTLYDIGTWGQVVPMGEQSYLEIVGVGWQTKWQCEDWKPRVVNGLYTVTRNEVPDILACISGQGWGINFRAAGAAIPISWNQISLANDDNVINPGSHWKEAARLIRLVQGTLDAPIPVPRKLRGPVIPVELERQPKPDPEELEPDDRKEPDTRTRVKRRHFPRTLPDFEIPRLRPEKPTRHIERKVTPRNYATWKALADRFGFLTELNDLVKALYKALPWNVQDWENDRTMQDKLARLIDNIEKLQWGSALENILLDQLTDDAIGRMGGLTREAIQHAVRTGNWNFIFGTDVGPGLTGGPRGPAF